MKFDPLLSGKVRNALSWFSFQQSLFQFFLSTNKVCTIVTINVLTQSSSSKATDTEVLGSIPGATTFSE